MNSNSMIVIVALVVCARVKGVRPGQSFNLPSGYIWQSNPVVPASRSGAWASPIKAMWVDDRQELAWAGYSGDRVNVGKISSAESHVATSTSPLLALPYTCTFMARMNEGLLCAAFNLDGDHIRYYELGADGGPLNTWHATDFVSALAALSDAVFAAGWCSDYTAECAVDLFNMSPSKHAPIAPFQSLPVPRYDTVTAFLVLEANGLAVCTLGGVHLFNASSLRPGGPASPFQVLLTHDLASPMVLLPGFGLAVGTQSPISFVDLFNLSSLQPGGPPGPFKSIKTNGTVQALAVLDNNGLAVGTASDDDFPNVHLFNLPTLQSHGPAAPFQSLQANGNVYALAVLDGIGLAVGTQVSTIDLLNSSSLQPGGPVGPFQSLLAYETVKTLAVFEDHGLAVGGKKNAIALFNLSGVQSDGPETVTLQASGSVTSLSSLDDMGLAVGTKESIVDLFNLSALQPHRPLAPFQSLQASGNTNGKVTATAGLDGRGLAIATIDRDILHRHTPTLDLFNASSLQPHGPVAPFQSHAMTDFITTLAVLDGGVLAVGKGDNFTNPIEFSGLDLYNLSSPQSHGLAIPFQSLSLHGSSVNAISILEDKGLAIGTDRGLHLYELWSSSETREILHLFQFIPLDGRVEDLTVLEDSGLAVVTDGGSRIAAGLISLFNLSSWLPHGPADPFSTSAGSGKVETQVVLKEKRTALGTDEDTVDLHAGAGQQLERLRTSPNADLSMPHAEGLVGNADLDLNFTKPFAELRVHGAGPMFFNQNTKDMPQWFMGYSAIEPVMCPASTTKLNNTHCTSCPPGFSSIAGGLCEFVSAQTAIRAHLWTFVFSVGAFLTSWLVCYFVGSRTTTGAPSASAKAAQLFLKMLIWVVALLSLAFASASSLDWFWMRVFAIMVVCKILLALAHLIDEASARQAAFAYASAGYFSVVLSTVWSLVATSTNQSIMTPLGRLHERQSPFVVSVFIGPPMVEILCEVFRCVSPDSAGSSDVGMARNLETQVPLLGIERDESGGGEWTNGCFERCCPRCWSCIQAVYRHIQAARSWLNSWRCFERCCARCCQCIRFANTGIQAAKSLLNSWRGRHCQVVVMGLFSMLLLAAKIVLSDAISTAGQGAAISAIAVALLMVTSSAISLKTGTIDMNFRRVVMLKAMLVMAKTILLAYPEQNEIVDVRYMWSCVQQHCPSSCTSKPDGFCANVGSPATCRCQSLRPDNLVLILTISTSTMSGTLTIVDFASIIFKQNFTLRSWKALVGIFICNIIYLVGLFLAIVLPISAYSGRPFAAGVFALPLIPLSLLVNETKWITQAFSTSRSDVPIVKEKGGLKISHCAFIVVVVVASVILWEDVRYAARQPKYTQPHEGKYLYMSYLAITALTSGAFASFLLL